MLGSLLGSLENIFSHADKFKNIHFAGLDYDYYERYTDAVKNITSEEILRLAQKYFDLEKFYRVIVGKFWGKGSKECEVRNVNFEMPFSKWKHIPIIH